MTSEIMNGEGLKSQLTMGWLRLVGSIKLQVSCTEHSLFYRALLPKRPIILIDPTNRSHTILDSSFIDFIVYSFIWFYSLFYRAPLQKRPIILIDPTDRSHTILNSSIIDFIVYSFIWFYWCVP